MHFMKYNEFRVEKSAVLFAADMVTSGRAANGEVFQYDIYSSKTKIYADGELILYDCCRRCILGKPAVRLRKEFLVDDTGKK